MTIYRVGDSGATVFNADGKPLAVLRPGSVVVEGRIRDVGSLADQYHGKRLSGYADKSVHPAEDK